ncbi:hypothetical protein [Cupriavidus necator]
MQYFPFLGENLSMSRSRKTHDANAMPLRVQPWRLDLLFSPVFRILTALEREAELTVGDDGRIKIFSQEKGLWEDVVAQILCLAEICHMSHVCHDQWPDPTSLFSLGSKLDTGESLMIEELALCRKVAQECHMRMGHLNHVQLMEILEKVYIKSRLPTEAGSVVSNGSPAVE